MKISSLIPALAAATVLFAALPCHAAVGVVPMQRGSLMVLAADSIAPDKAEAPEAKTPKPTKEEKARAKFMSKHKADLDRLAELKARVAHLNDNMQTLRNEQSVLQAETDRLLPLAAERNRQRALTDSLRTVFHRHLTDRLHEQQARSFADIDTLGLARMAAALRLDHGNATSDSLAARVQALEDARRTFFAAKNAWEKDRNPLPILQAFGPAQQSEREQLCRQEMLWKAARIKLSNFIRRVVNHKDIRSNRQNGWDKENAYVLKDSFSEDQAQVTQDVAPFADLKSNLNSFIKDLTSRVEPGDIEKRYTNDTNTSTP